MSTEVTAQGMNAYETAGPTGPKRTCDCGVCITCKQRRSARRRYHGTVYTPLAFGHFKTATILLPTDQATVGYLAGLLDGEGCITKQNKSWRVQIAMTDEPVVRWLGQLGGSVRQRRVQPSRLPCWRWLLMRQLDVLIFLEVLLPHLRVKRAHAAAVIVDIKRRTDERFAVAR